MYPQQKTLGDLLEDARALRQNLVITLVRARTEEVLHSATRDKMIEYLEGEAHLDDGQPKDWVLRAPVNPYVELE